jgi:hypothetical protein
MLAATVFPRATGAMVPDSRRHHIQQSANIIGDCCLCRRRRWRREWGTMVAAVGHLGHKAWTDFVGWLWVVTYVGIQRVLYQAINDTLPMR